MISCVTGALATWPGHSSGRMYRKRSCSWSQRGEGNGRGGKHTKGEFWAPESRREHRGTDGGAGPAAAAEGGKFVVRPCSGEGCRSSADGRRWSARGCGTAGDAEGTGVGVSSDGGEGRSAGRRRVRDEQRGDDRQENDGVLRAKEASEPV
mmetsp:Transcript_25819/g.51416  ORF Transcript_25819/g.51416 Transcript_25819/m.51416 type:complete len:151 (-) Transcript_25819:121-573(-)